MSALIGCNSRQVAAAHYQCCCATHDGSQLARATLAWALTVLCRVQIAGQEEVLDLSLAPLHAVVKCLLGRFNLWTVVYGAHYTILSSDIAQAGFDKGAAGGALAPAPKAAAVRWLESHADPPAWSPTTASPRISAGGQSPSSPPPLPASAHAQQSAGSSSTAYATPSSGSPAVQGRPHDTFQQAESRLAAWHAINGAVSTGSSQVASPAHALEHAPRRPPSPVHATPAQMQPAQGPSLAALAPPQLQLQLAGVRNAERSPSRSPHHLSPVPPRSPVSPTQQPLSPPSAAAAAAAAAVANLQTNPHAAIRPPARQTVTSHPLTSAGPSSSSAAPNGLRTSMAQAASGAASRHHTIHSATSLPSLTPARPRAEQPAKQQASGSKPAQRSNSAGAYAASAAAAAAAAAARARESARLEQPATSAHCAPPEGCESLDCSLCLEYILKASIACAPCGHVFHRVCLQNMLESRPQCPVCAKPCKPNQVLKLFL